MSRERDKYRKYESGATKAKKKCQREQFFKSQKGAFEKYLQPSSSKTTLEHEYENEEDQSDTDIDKVNSSEIPNPKISETESESSSHTVTIPNVDEHHPPHDFRTDSAINPRSDLGKPSYTEVDVEPDPGTWPDIMTSEMIDKLVTKGPVRVINFDFPLNENQRKFSPDFYIRTMQNGETQDRKWLVYSKNKDKVFCFSCKLFGSPSISHLKSEGHDDWKHLGHRLKLHEESPNHVMCLKKWLECEMRLKKRSGVDKLELDMLETERERWRQVLKRILLAIKYLAQHNMALRGTHDKLFQENNGNFLGLIEMISQFDPVLQEHLRRIKSKEIHDHYLGKTIQNELINLMADKVKSYIINNVKESKYFSIILDCTPDTSHKEQMTMILRFLNLSNEAVSVEEHFIDFLNVMKTTGESLTETLLTKLDELGLDIKNCRGQSYDNGANMKGHRSGVQTRVLKCNPRAFYVPCASHNLNLVLSDAAKSSAKAITFFGIVQRIYAVFGASTQRWDILLRKIPSLTLKKHSDTRWESRVESVKAIRYQANEVRDALLEVSNSTDDPKTKSEAHSLAVNELESYEFVVGLVIWYDILFAINAASKTLQAENMDLKIATNSLNGLVKYIERYRNEGYISAQITAKEIAENLQIEPKFEEKRVGRKRKMFVYESSDMIVKDQSPEEKFKIEFFYPIVDTVLNSVQERFGQLKKYSEIFGFLFSPDSLKSLHNDELKAKWEQLELELSVGLNEGFSKDIVASHLLTEIEVFKDMIPDDINTPKDILMYLSKLGNPFPNIYIAYRILLTIPVTVASAERSFSRLKLIKTYLRSSISQERLSSLAMLSIEHDVAAKLNFDEIINDFAQKKARKQNFL